MPCDFPEHHSSGGGWGGPIAAIFAAMVAAALIGPWLHWILLAFACIIIGAVITGILVVRARLRQHQRLQHLVEHGYTPYLQPPQQQPLQFPGPAAGAPDPGPAAAAGGGSGRRAAPALPRHVASGDRRGDAAAARRPVNRPGRWHR
jgi:hypothetical protein